MIETASKPIRETFESAKSRLGVATLIWANSMSFLHRLGRGEGLLVVVALSIALFARPDAMTFLAQAFVATAVLTLLYFLNDVHDCRNDLNDEGKDQSFVRFCVLHRARLFQIMAVEKAVTIALALVLLGPRSAIAVVAVFVVNFVYSTVFKGRAFLDVPWACLWGALYVLVTGVVVPFTVLALVGIMTSICHVFQIRRDRRVDEVNRVNTSAVAAPWLADDPDGDRLHCDGSNPGLPPGSFRGSVRGHAAGAAPYDARTGLPGCFRKPITPWSGSWYWVRCMGFDSRAGMALAFGRSLLSWYIDGTPRPISATFAVTNRCNLRCSYCNTPYLDPRNLLCRDRAASRPARWLQREAPRSGRRRAAGAAGHRRHRDLAKAGAST